MRRCELPNGRVFVDLRETWATVAPPSGALVLLDTSASMDVERQTQTKQIVHQIAVLVGGASRLLLASFDVTAALLPSISAYRSSGKGTSLSAAIEAISLLRDDCRHRFGDGMDAAASWPLVVITDAEQLTDHSKARAQFVAQGLEDFVATRRVVLLGIGTRHRVHDIMTLFPSTVALRMQYVCVPTVQQLTAGGHHNAGRPGCPGCPSRPASGAGLFAVGKSTVDVGLHLHGVLQAAFTSAAVTVGGTVMFVPRSQGVLVPLGVGVEDVEVDGCCVAALPSVPPQTLCVESGDVTPCAVQLMRLQQVAALQPLVASYNGGLADLLVHNVTQADLLGGSALAAAKDRVACASERDEAALRTAQVGALGLQMVHDVLAACRETACVEVQSLRDLGRHVGKGVHGSAKAAVQDLVEAFRAFESTLKVPPSEAAYVIAQDLFDRARTSAASAALDGSKLKGAELGRLLTQAAHRVDSTAWDRAEAALGAGSGGAGSSVAGAAGAASGRVSLAPSGVVEEVVFVRALWAALVTDMAQEGKDLKGQLGCRFVKEDDAVLAVVGWVDRVPLVAVHDPLQTRVDGHRSLVSKQPYSVKVLRNLLPDQGSLHGGEHEFLSDAGPVNAVVGMLPRSSPCDPAILKVVASELCTGSWIANPGTGMRAMWSLLAGLAIVSLGGPEGCVRDVDFARLLAVGWAQVACVVLVHPLRADGKVAAGDMVPCLVAALQMLKAAAKEPHAWLGTHVAAVCWWRALLWVHMHIQRTWSLTFGSADLLTAEEVDSLQESLQLMAVVECAGRFARQSVRVSERYGVSGSSLVDLRRDCMAMWQEGFARLALFGPLPAGLGLADIVHMPRAAAGSDEAKAAEARLLEHLGVPTTLGASFWTAIAVGASGLGPEVTEAARNPAAWGDRVLRAKQRQVSRVGAAQAAWLRRVGASVWQAATEEDLMPVPLNVGAPVGDAAVCAVLYPGGVVRRLDLNPCTGLPRKVCSTPGDPDLFLEQSVAQHKGRTCGERPTVGTGYLRGFHMFMEEYVRFRLKPVERAGPGPRDEACAGAGAGEAASCRPWASADPERDALLRDPGFESACVQRAFLGAKQWAGVDVLVLQHYVKMWKFLWFASQEAVVWARDSGASSEPASPACVQRFCRKVVCRAWGTESPLNFQVSPGTEVMALVLLEVARARTSGWPLDLAAVRNTLRSMRAMVICFDKFYLSMVGRCLVLPSCPGVDADSPMFRGQCERVYDALLREKTDAILSSL